MFKTYEIEKARPNNFYCWIKRADDIAFNESVEHMLDAIRVGDTEAILITSIDLAKMAQNKERNEHTENAINKVKQIIGSLPSNVCFYVQDLIDYCYHNGISSYWKDEYNHSHRAPVGICYAALADMEKNGSVKRAKDESGKTMCIVLF